MEDVMHGQSMKYLLVAAGALIVGLMVAGNSLQSVLPFLLLLACPLMMVLMMRGMGHGDQGADHSGAGREHDDAATRR
jgi:hypothetical protein